MAVAPSEPGKKLTEAVGAILWRAPSADELAHFGLTEDDIERPTVEVWPEAWDAWCAFLNCFTQWRTGPSGPIGLDYLAVEREIERSGADVAQAMADIRVLESAALNIMLKSEK